MKTKEKFLDEMSNLWDKLQDIEQTSSDFYEFEKRFEHEMNTLEHHTLQDILGSEKRDRRVKKSPDPLRNSRDVHRTQIHTVSA
jgi:hypothetical protein